MWWLGLFACAEPAATPEPLGLCTACTATCEESFSLATSANHVWGGVDYDDPPPTSGDHDPCWAAWGVHTTPVPDEQWVHNLEHGGVVFLYNCPDDCPDERDALAALTDTLGVFALLTPYDALPTRFGAVAWQWRFLTDCFQADDFAQFWQARRDQAPESTPAPPPADCASIAPAE